MATGDFYKKVVIVTGSSSGTGQATAILFAKKGASVVLCGRDEERLKAAMDQCMAASGGHADRFISVSGDLNDAQVRQATVDKTIQAFGRLDILVTNAGIILPGATATEATEEAFEKLFNSNVKSIFFLIQAALPHLEKSGGNIVSVSSNASTTLLGSFVLYAMTKAAVDHMTRCLALDLAPKGIRVNAVNPSYMVTNIGREIFGSDADKIAKLLEQTDGPNHPLRGECISVDDVANVISFLASDAARSVTGQCYLVDNGRQFTAGIPMGMPDGWGT